LGATKGDNSWIKFRDWRGTAGHERFHQINRSFDYDSELEIDRCVPGTNINAPSIEKYFK
jgi:hypothetical protein